MMRIAVCDDEQLVRSYLSSLIKRQSHSCEVREYTSAGAYLTGGWDADLLFLDIELAASKGEPDGMDLARRIRGMDLWQQPVIVFVTGYESYVYDAFDVGAFQYLLKPVDEEKFSRVFARAVEQIEKQKKEPLAARMLTVQFAGTSRTILLADLYYAESSNHRVVLHLKEETIAYYAKIGDLELRLRPSFFRIHKGYLVNLACVEAYTKTEVLLTNGERLLISKYKYQEFVRAYLRFLKRGMSDG